MTKEDQIIEMIGEAAVQATQQVLDLEHRVTEQFALVDNRLNSLENKIDAVESRVMNEMHELRNENSKFHDELIGYFKRAEQERVFTSEHLHRHDGQIMELQTAVGIK